MIYREMICGLINRVCNKGVGVEIGVKLGETSDKILSDTSISHLYMIDPWVKNYSVIQGLYSKKRDPEKDHSYVLNKFSDNNRCTILRKFSHQAINDIPNNLDFIFIDANHEYDYVMQDLELWVPKVRHEGLIIGDDWWGKFPDVEKAVVEFAQKTSFFKDIRDIDPIYDHFIPAPSKSPVIMKSWPKAHLWWTLKSNN